MLLTELPQRLREEFERSARLLYDRDGVAKALIEAVELWLVQRREALLEAEKNENDRAFDTLKVELERDHFGKWAVIAYGKLQGLGNSLEEVEQFASTAQDRIVIQIGEGRPREVELGWQMTFA